MLTLPFVPENSQTYEIELDGKLFTLRYIFNSRMNCWSATLLDNLQKVVMYNATMVRGKFLFEGYGFNNEIPQNVLITSSTTQTDIPSYETLGVAFLIEKLTTEEYELVEGVLKWLVE